MSSASTLFRHLYYIQVPWSSYFSLFTEKYRNNYFFYCGMSKGLAWDLFGGLDRRKSDIWCLVWMCWNGKPELGYSVCLIWRYVEFLELVEANIILIIFRLQLTVSCDSTVGILGKHQSTKLKCIIGRNWVQWPSKGWVDWFSARPVLYITLNTYKFSKLQL